MHEDVSYLTISHVILAKRVFSNYSMEHMVLRWRSSVKRRGDAENITRAHLCLLAYDISLSP